jgi:hypothetical protein
MKKMHLELGEAKNAARSEVEELEEPMKRKWNQGRIGMCIEALYRLLRPSSSIMSRDYTKAAVL